MTELAPTADELRRRLGRLGIFSGAPSRIGIDPADDLPALGAAVGLLR